MNERHQTAERSAKRRKPDWALAVAAAVAAALNLFGIWNDAYVNAYYTAAVTSMLQSWHNFFYASFDPGGFVTVDKPPLTFWVQTISAKLFGLHGWSVILPQALAGVGSVLLVYALVKPSFGRPAARLAALAAACTPVAAAVSRTNNVDSLLVFTLLVATWLLFKTVRTGKWGWAACAFAVVGLGFNEKMLQAYMVLPAFYLFCLIAFKAGWRRKLAVLAVSTAALVAVSLAWAVYVDSVPKSERPYIGSSGTNSVLELALGYNGVSRLTGDRSVGGGQDGGQGGTGGLGGRFPGGNGGGASPVFGGGAGRGGGGGMFNTGTAGPLRLFRSQLSGQASWLLPFALLAAAGIAAGYRRKRPVPPKLKEALFWLAWLLPGMGFFSVAGFFHPYYLVMLAPPIAALVGAGWRSRLLPIALLVTTAFQAYVLYPYANTIGILWPVAVGVAGIALAILLAARLWSQRGNCFVAIAGLAVLLLAPLYWAATPIVYGQSSQLPEAGPSGQSGPFGGGGRGGNSLAGIDEGLYAYLQAHRTGEKFLFATSNIGTAESYVIHTGEAVMAMGGYSGSDPILTVGKLKRLVEDGEVKYFYLSGGGRGGSSEAAQWIEQNGTAVPSSAYESAADASDGGNGGGDGAAGSGAMGRFGGFGGGGRSGGTLYEVQLNGEEEAQ